MLIHTRTDTFTETGTNQLYPLLTKASEGSSERFKWETSAPELYAYDGDREWVYLKNASGGALVKGNVLQQKTIAAGVEVGFAEKAAVGANPLRILGVVQTSVADGEFFWAVRSGDCEVLAGTETIDVGELLAVSATDAGTAMEAGSLNTGGTIAQFSTSLDPVLRAFGIARENAAAAATARCRVDCRG